LNPVQHGVRRTLDQHERARAQVTEALIAAAVALEALGQTLQSEVAEALAVGAIDTAEPMHIESDDSESRVRWRVARQLQLPIQPLAEQRPLGKPGERIETRQILGCLGMPQRAQRERQARRHVLEQLQQLTILRQRRVLCGQCQRRNAPLVDYQRQHDQCADAVGKEQLARSYRDIRAGDVRAHGHLARTQRTPHEAGVGILPAADLDPLQRLTVGEERAGAVLEPRPAAAADHVPYSSAEESAQARRETTGFTQQLLAIANTEHRRIHRALHADHLREPCDLALLPRLLQLCAHRLQAEGQIGCELLQKRDLRVVEGVRTIRVDAQRTDARAIQRKRQGDGGSVAFAMRFLTPGAKVGIALDAPADLGSALANRAPGGSAAPLVSAPTDLYALHITTVAAGVRHGPHGTVGIIIGEADPGQLVTAGSHQNPADPFQQFGFPLRARERTLAIDQHPQLAIGLGERGFGAGRIGQQCAGKRPPGVRWGLPSGTCDALFDRPCHYRRTHPRSCPGAYYRLPRDRRDSPPPPAGSPLLRGLTRSIREAVHTTVLEPTNRPAAVWRIYLVGPCAPNLS